MDPTPTPLTRLVTDEDVALHRSVSCSEYDQCLDLVLRRRWRSWTCAQCALFSLARRFATMAAAHEGSLRPFA